MSGLCFGLPLSAVLLDDLLVLFWSLPANPLPKRFSLPDEKALSRKQKN